MHIQRVGDSPAWRGFASKLLPLHHALGAGNHLLRTTYSLQKHLSSTIFFRPLQKSGITQTCQNVRPCSVLRFWCQTGLLPCWCCKDRPSKMCVLLRNTAHQRPVLILLSAIASEWLNPHYEMSLACKNWARFQWMASPRHPSTKKKALSLCLACQAPRQKSPFPCMTSLHCHYPTAKTESLHPIQTVMAKLIQHLWEKSHNEPFDRSQKMWVSSKQF